MENTYIRQVFFIAPVLLPLRHALAINGVLSPTLRKKLEGLFPNSFLSQCHAKRSTQDLAMYGAPARIQVADGDCGRLHTSLPDILSKLGRSPWKHPTRG